MKKLFLLTLSLFYLFIFPVAAKSLSFACSPWEPYTGKEMPQQGILADLAREIGKEAKIDIMIDFKPWARVINELKAGRLDGTYCVIKTEERKNFLHFSEKPILKLANGFFRLKATEIDYHTPKDLIGLRVGALRDSSDEVYLNDLMPETFKAQPFRDNVTGMKMLLGNRFDLLMMGRLVGETVLKDNLPEEQEKVIYYKDIVTSDIYLALSQEIPNAQTLIQQLEQAHARLSEAGKLTAIYQKHGFQE